jgi:NAD(P)-dependent dehydrogenase (short-subunit alcohol dehydrogenase family)
VVLWSVSKKNGGFVMLRIATTLMVLLVSAPLVGWTQPPEAKNSKEAFTDSLAQQLAPLGVQVGVVEPVNYASEIGKNAAKRTGVETRFTDRSKYKEPDDVAIAVEQERRSI